MVFDAQENRFASCVVAVLFAILAGCSSQTPNSDLRLLDLNGQLVDPFGQADAKAFVFLFTRTDCPISNRYAPVVRRLHEEFNSQGVAFCLVYLDPDESAETVRQHVQQYNYPCRALRDPQHRLVQLTGARVTPEAAVFVPGGQMLYRGRIDDAVVDFGKVRAAPTTHDLREALRAILAGQPVETSTTKAVGCFIDDLK